MVSSTDICSIYSIEKDPSPCVIERMTVAYPSIVANGMSACTVLLMSRVTTSLICPRRLTVLSGYVDRAGQWAYIKKRPRGVIDQKRYNYKK